MCGSAHVKTTFVSDASGKDVQLSPAQQTLLQRCLAGPLDHGSTPATADMSRVVKGPGFTSDMQEAHGDLRQATEHIT